LIIYGSPEAKVILLRAEFQNNNPRSLTSYRKEAYLYQKSIMRFGMKFWQKVRRDLGSQPLAEGMVVGDAPLFVEHYLFKDIERTVSAADAPVFLTQFGGSRVREGEQGSWRATVMPSQSLLVPANCKTHWHYTGTVDFAVFYFPDQVSGVSKRLQQLAAKASEPLAVNDALVSSLALQLVKEVHKGRGCDEGFMSMLSVLMLEQSYRSLTTPETSGFNPRHVHFSRLQTVLSYIREHLGEDLSVPTLAGKAGVSVAHFRRLFLEAMGTPPHRYVIAARLEQARTLLAVTTMPIGQIGEVCGFSSQSHFTACFRSTHASTPAEYRLHIKQAPVRADALD
jgi:AraC family transcriptional regulator